MALEQKDLSSLLETAIVSARLAGQKAMEDINYVKSSVKGGDEIVTESDARCQKLIIDRIKESYPDHGFIGEEGTGGKLFKQTPRGDEQIWWIIDPIDGTNNYSHQMPIFTVSIAAMHEGRPIVGVVFDPATERMYTAVAGDEAQLNGRRITVSEDKMDMFTSVALNSSFTDTVPQWAQYIILNSRFRNLGTLALELAYLACGSLVAVVAGTIKLWDIAAGALIIESAGGIVTDYKGNKLFPMNTEAYGGSRFEILAANKKTYGELLSLLQK
jgi:myo-inositol-1(or 4)-monophosphatase